MPKLNLKPNHKAIRDYYTTLQQYEHQGITHEGAVSSPFDTLLQSCAKQVNATLVPQYLMRAPKGNRIVIDGAILDEYGLPLGYWEAKDIDDDLAKAVQEKQNAGYPLDNILFQTPQRAILYQNGQEVLDVDITEPAHLIDTLQYLFFYVPPALDKMKLSKDKTQLKYNDFLTLDGIPTEVYEYRLGTRSALEWVVDQYRVKVDKRSGIVNDPNREAEPRYIVDLIASVITVSLKTVEIVRNLPTL